LLLPALPLVLAVHEHDLLPVEGRERDGRVRGDDRPWRVGEARGLRGGPRLAAVDRLADIDALAVVVEIHVDGARGRGVGPEPLAVHVALAARERAALGPVLAVVRRDGDVLDREAELVRHVDRALAVDREVRVAAAREDRVIARRAQPGEEREGRAAVLRT